MKLEDLEKMQRDIEMLKGQKEMQKILITHLTTMQKVQQDQIEMALNLPGEAMHSLAAVIDQSWENRKSAMRV